jgi:DNA polymerase-3 subunit alpha
MAEFVHLHVHSHFTLLESTVTVPRLLKSVLAKGMHQVALTDRGNLFAAYEFYAACKDTKAKAKETAEAVDKLKAANAAAEALAKAEKDAAKAAGEVVKGIIGCHVNVAPGGMSEKTQPKEWSNLVLLAQDEVGYRNLVRLVSKGWLEGFYYEPKVDLDAIRAHAEGLVCLTGAGRRGFLNRHALVAPEEARNHLGRLKDVFGERLFVEITRLSGGTVDEDEQMLRANVELARWAELPLVATNWVHYLDAPDASIHDTLLAVSGVTTLADPKRMRMSSQEFWLKGPEEMARLFHDLPEALANTVRVGEMCATSQVPHAGYAIPTFPCPDGLDEAALLRRLCAEGMVRRYGDGITEAHRERLAFELETIIRMGFPGYFLIVADFINWAKGTGIPVGPGRGSAAGSLVAYAMGITDMCPLQYGLLFERFLNPGRKSMPDIDIDFCKDRREEVIRYVSQKYGAEAVTQIMTLGTMKARMAIKDVARAYEWTPEEAQELANLVPEDPSGKHDLAVCLGKKPLDPKKNEFDPSEQMVKRYNGDERTRRALDAALQLEKLGRSLGVHACGMIIAPGPVSGYLPVCTIKGKAATQYNMTQVEKCGLLKMDFLGLKTMSILKKAVDIVRATTGAEIDLLKVPLADRRTFELLGTGATLGVFQCESTGFQELIRLLKPDRFEDVIALVALYRPGPLMANMHIDYCDRKAGRAKVEYPHPSLEIILGETYGLYIYQEQVMQISRELCGFSPAEADDLRKAMGKKDLKILEKLKERFVGGAWERHQFDKAKCEAMWNNILGFASYCFNKSHSACYGLIAYWTAWMKANHFGAFMTANLIYEMGDKEKMTKFVEELRTRSIPVLPPDANESGWEFTYTGQAIRFGFGGVKGVGEGAAAHLVETRARGGPFKTLYDLCERVDTRVINKRVVEALIKVGALDSLHANRNALFQAMERAFDRGHQAAERRSTNQETLFGMFAEDTTWKAQSEGYPAVPDWSESERLGFEKQLTGYWISSHPVRTYDAYRQRFALARAHELGRLQRGARTVVAAVVVGKREIKTKTGRMMAILQLEDEGGRFDAVLFPARANRRGEVEAGAFERFSGDCTPDLVALFVGTIEHRERRGQAPRPAAEDDGGDEAAPPPEAEDGDGAGAAPAAPAGPQISLQVTDMVPMTQVDLRLTDEVLVAVDAADASAPAAVAATENLLKEQRGACRLAFQVATPDGAVLTLEASPNWRLQPSAEAKQRLAAIWSEERVLVRWKDLAPAERMLALLDEEE